LSTTVDQRFRFKSAKQELSITDLHRRFKAMALVDSAELFEAISHPVRIKILKILQKQPAGFASLKRKLDIDSSGNLDHHLKKLAELITVREDGLYGLTDAGKEALLSIEAVEMWVEVKRPRIRIPAKIPKEVMFLVSLEVCATLLVFWFLTIVNVPSNWGYLPPVALLFGGLGAAFGISTQQKSSWNGVLARAPKSALIFSMGLLLLNYLRQPGGISESNSTAIFYVAFVGVEAITVVLALRRPLQDFLGIHEASRMSLPTVIASLLCISSGILLVALKMTQQLSNEVDFAIFMNDVTILAGLTIIIGGVLILLKSYIPGALLSILCGLYPRPPDGFHAYDFISKMGFPAGVNNPSTTLVAVMIGLLPIVGGAIAMLIVMRKIRFQ
jgi:DNA-binding HxlR family transcriptional regulator